MSGFRPADSKREEFRKYLEKAGVLDALTKVLVSLYEEPEKPSDALDYMKQSLSAASAETAEMESLRNEVEELRAKVEILTKENTELKEKCGEMAVEAEGEGEETPEPVAVDEPPPPPGPPAED